MSLHDLTAETIDHKAQPLSDYKGQVLLVVNTASECGSTPQYAGLEKLWREYKGRGLAVLGFPSNDFGAQEPGTEAEIKSFCSTNYQVTFPALRQGRDQGGRAVAGLQVPDRQARRAEVELSQVSRRQERRGDPGLRHQGRARRSRAARRDRRGAGLVQLKQTTRDVLT